MRGFELLSNSTLNSVDEVIDAAKALVDPVVVWDTSKGSALSRFWLCEFDTWARYCEIPRAVFLKVREEGMLETGPDAKRTVDRYQAWPVKVD